MSLYPAPVLIHITDGAPRDMADAARNGYSTREEYAAARRVELLNALNAGGITPAEIIMLGCVDQEASLRLVEITRALKGILHRHHIEAVLTHPYEGGHPDHDAAAFAVHQAFRCLPAAGRPKIVEFTSYHGRDGKMETGCFLPGDGTTELVFPLSLELRLRKTRMVDCFRTQRSVLQHFRLAEERFRPAPEYDFTKPPHAGQLLYEQYPWGMTAERWRGLAQSAQDALGV